MQNTFCKREIFANEFAKRYFYQKTIAVKLKDKVYLQELREQFLQKIIDEWEVKWQAIFNEFESFELIKNKNSFLEALLADIETCLYQKLNGQSSKYLFSKDFLRRFIYEYGNKDARIQSHSRTGILLYLNYDSWEDFVAKNPIDDSQHININYLNIDESLLPVFLKNQSLLVENQGFIDFQELRPKKNYKKYLWGTLGIIFILSTLYFVFNWWQNRPFSAEDVNKVKFEIIKTVGRVPQAVRIKYDISSLINVRNVEVETGVGKILTATHFEGFSFVSDKKIDTLAQTYFYPGVYQLALLANDKVIKHINHVVYSKPNIWNVWGFGVAYEKDWITNINPAKNYIKDGVFHFNPDELPKEIKDENDLRNTTHALVQDFGVRLDSLEVETRLKNPQNEGGESCYDMQISLFDKKFNSIGAKFTTEGCTDFATLSAGKTYFRILNNKQKNVDLDNFGVNQDEWNVFKLIVKGNTLAVFVNEKLAFKGNFETNETCAGLVDLRIVFKGAGSIDWVKISNSFTNKVVYQTNFDE